MRASQLLALVLVGFGLLLGACGGSPPAGVASLGSTTATTQASSSPAVADNAASRYPTTTQRPPQKSQRPASQTAGSGGGAGARYAAALAYVDCMRSHGVSSFPDPTSDGQINVKFASGGKDGAPASSGIDRMSPQYISADQTCRHLLPGGVPAPAQNQQALARELKFAQCMRSHGVSGFPDPTDAGVVRLLGVDQSSPRYQGAQKACDALVPGSYSK